MPVYEYACTTCGERTEARQSFDDPPLEECPVCGGRLRKLYSPVGIVFKGSGFYSTESKKGSQQRDGQAAPSPDSDKGDKEKTKKESSSGTSSDSASGSGASGAEGSGSKAGSNSGTGSTGGSSASSGAETTSS